MPPEVQRLAVEARRRALARNLHETSRLEDQLAKLCLEADAYRARAITLNAQLMTLPGMRAELAEMRETLLASAARIDRAVEELRAAVAKVA